MSFAIQKYKEMYSNGQGSREFSWFLLLLIDRGDNSLFKH